jgi:hypothetical protein
MLTYFFLGAMATSPARCLENHAAKSHRFSRQSQLRFKQILQRGFAFQQAQPPFNQLLLFVARNLMGTPYRANTLEQQDFNEARLILNLEAVDCVTFVENALVLARMIRLGQQEPEKLAEHIETIRYRGGKRAGYGSRLHYFSEWLTDGETKGWLRLIPGPDSERKSLHRLSDRISSRAPDPIRNNLRQTESSLSMVPLRFYSCRHRMDSLLKLLQPGDILGFVSPHPDLDITHVGFAIPLPAHGEKADTAWHLLNAPAPGQKVKISPYRLQDACTVYQKSLAGFILARPVEPPPDLSELKPPVLGRRLATTGQGESHRISGSTSVPGTGNRPRRRVFWTRGPWHPNSAAVVFPGHP